MMMVGFNDANEINQSDYLTYIPYDQDRGLHYENLDPTRAVGAEYKLVTYFSLNNLIVII